MRLSTDRLGLRWVGLLPAAALVLASAAAQAEAPAPVWVHLLDKGPSARTEALPQALAAREAELPARTLARRHRARGAAAVDARDLPVDPRYVARLEATGARVRVASRWLNAVSVEATPEQRAQIAALPEVIRVTPVARGRREPEPLPLVEPLPPGDPGMDVFGLAGPQLQLIGATTLQQHCGLTGSGVVVGVQDSGFDLSHQAFASLTVLDAYDFIDDDGDVGTEPGEPVYQAEHGTRVLGMLAGSDPGTFMGVAPGVSVILSKTEDISSETPIEEDYYVAGLEWIEQQGADVFTASLGYINWYEVADLDGQTAVTSIAVNVAFDNGLVVVASLGNGGPGPMTIAAPGDAFGALGVGAVDLAGVVASFSSRGPTADGRIKPDVSAPGSGTTSVGYGTLDQYGSFGGTSAAAPLAAGLVALLLQARPTLTAQEVMDLLRATSSQAVAPDNDLGWGVLDGRLASGDACGCNDADGDGHLGLLCGGDDCDDGDATVHPGAAEICGDGLDNDCMGGDEPCPSSTGGDETGSPGSGGTASGSGSTASGSGGTASDSGGPGDTGLGSTSGGPSTESTAPADDDPGGCACTSAPGPARWPGALGLLVLLRARPRALSRRPGRRRCPPAAP